MSLNPTPTAPLATNPAAVPVQVKNVQKPATQARYPNLSGKKTILSIDRPLTPQEADTLSQSTTLVYDPTLNKNLTLPQFLGSSQFFLVLYDFGDYKAATRLFIQANKAAIIAACDYHHIGSSSNPLSKHADKTFSSIPIVDNIEEWFANAIPTIQEDLETVVEEVKSSGILKKIAACFSKGS